MTKSELDKWRFRAPFLIMSTTLVPIAVALIIDAATQTKVIQIVIIPMCLFMAYVYSAMKWRGYYWRRELDSHVGEKIRSELLALLPGDLNTTDAERQRLREQAVYRKLTGVFWEAIDGDEELRRHKEHFYANGALYTTAIDLYIILLPISLVYSILSMLTPRHSLLFILVSVACLVVSVISRSLIVPACRKRHLELSDEQLDLLKRKRRDFVVERYRDIVTEWRRQGPSADVGGQAQ